MNKNSRLLFVLPLLFLPLFLALAGGPAGCGKTSSSSGGDAGTTSGDGGDGGGGETEGGTGGTSGTAAEGTGGGPGTGFCGDGTVGPGEGCDDGNADDTDDCPASCQPATCGDGFVKSGSEACDDGNTEDADACEADCSLPACGNGIIDQGELCYNSATSDIWDGTGSDPKTPGPLAVGDLTGDGIDDFATVVTYNFLEPSSISLFVGGPAGMTPERNYYSNKIPRGIAAGDFTGDGKADLAIVNSYFNANPALDLDKVRIMPNVSYNSGTGVFNFSPVDVKETGEDPRAVAFGDLDNKNNKDVVVANSQGDSVSVFLKNSGNTFADGVAYGVGDDPRGVVIGDLNGDGYNDIVASNVGGQSVSVLMNKDDGTGTFNAKVDYDVVDAVAYPSSGTPFSLAIGDVDNDGDLDVVALAFGTPDLVSVLRNDGTGILSLGANPGESYPTGDFPLAVSVGDLNNDGFVDIAVACFDSNAVSLYLNDAGAGFLPKQDVTVGTHPAGVGIGDFNGDGFPDVAATNQDSGDATVLFANP